MRMKAGRGEVAQTMCIYVYIYVSKCKTDKIKKKIKMFTYTKKMRIKDLHGCEIFTIYLKE
jgi:hypothetical protein